MPKYTPNWFIYLETLQANSTKMLQRIEAETSNQTA